MRHDVQADLSKKRPRPAARDEPHDLKAGFLREMAQAEFRIAIKIIRLFVAGPIHGRGEQHLAAGTQEAMEFAPHGERVRYVLKDFGAENGVQGIFRQRDAMRGAFEIHLAALGIEIARAFAGDVFEIARVRLLAATDVKQLASEFGRKERDAAFNERDADEGVIAGICPRAGLEIAIAVDCLEFAGPGGGARFGGRGRR